MKTQIIRRIFLAVIIIFISCQNFNSNAQTTHCSLNTILKTRKAVVDVTTLSGTTNAHKNTACITCNSFRHENALPAIPEPNGDHEFHSFHVKDKHAKHTNIFKNIANKMVEAIYYLVVLLVYIPFKH